MDDSAIDASDFHADACRAFRWQVPAHFNIAEACCARWARDTPDAVAIEYEHEDGRRARCSYRELQQDADRLACALRRRGVGRGDRVAIVMAQRIEAAVAHIAIYRLGAVAMPLSMLFGPEALEYRLRHGGSNVAIADEVGIVNLRSVRAACPALRCVLSVGDSGRQAAGGQHGGQHGVPKAGGADDDRTDHDADDWHAALAAEPASFDAVATAADDPAVLIYTSGTTGAPKGALMPHRALIGNLSGFVASQNGFGADAASVFWSPADWAWTGGLFDALLPTLYFGRTIVAFQGRFQPERAFELLQRHRVTHSFLFPTALKAMIKAVPRPRERYTLALQAVMSAGEAVGDAVFDYCEQQLGVTVNEMFGQTEVNYIVGNCAMSGAERRIATRSGWPARAGSMGRPYPGHRIAVIDDDGRECPRGTPGDIALHRRDIHGDPDPIFFLGYWQNDAATRDKFTGDVSDSWCRTGDTAVMDADGYLWYQGRSDDVFKSAGYRIGPSEIENCLVRHRAVANAAVVPKPDAERGALVKAFVVLAAGFEPSAQLVDELQRHVRGRLAPYEYPKEIEFIDALPMTTTGKLQRRLLRLREADPTKENASGPIDPLAR